jgi:hypothetical protein
MKIKFGLLGGEKEIMKLFLFRFKRRAKRNFFENLSKIIHARVVEIVEQVLQK